MSPTQALASHVFLFYVCVAVGLLVAAGAFGLALRDSLGCSAHTSLMSFGCEVAGYQQLKDAVRWLRERDVKILEVPADLSPGVDYHVHVLDLAGHAVQLYYYMEQVGWDGRPRPASARRRLVEPWPDALEPLTDTYADQTFQGPWG